jgi:GT2 family glycosyltransferase
MKFSATIVIYNENEDTLKRVLQNLLEIELEKEIVVVDNSDKDTLKESCQYDDVSYLFAGKNLGFGKAHNHGFKHLKKTSDIHLIVNPDIYFNPQEIKNFIQWMHKTNDISLGVTKVLYPDGTFQPTVRDIPTPFTLLKRKLGIVDDEWNKERFENITEIPFAHGCFFAFKYDTYKSINGFDEDFFMYMEDIDIFIRAKKYGKTVINPEYVIYHEFRKGSSKSLKLLLYHISSAIKFFTKY